MIPRFSPIVTACVRSLAPSLQRRPSIFRDPHQMEVDFEYSVRAPPAFRHPRSVSGAHPLKAVA